MFMRLFQCIQTLCIQMESSFWFATRLGIVHFIYMGYQVIIVTKNCIFLSEDLLITVQTVDSDEILNYVAFHLGLHCL